VFFLLIQWTLKFLSPDLLNVALGLYLLFALAHSLHPVLLQRLKPSAVPLNVIHLFPALALALILERDGVWYVTVSSSIRGVTTSNTPRLRRSMVFVSSVAETGCPGREPDWPTHAAALAPTRTTPKRHRRLTIAPDFIRTSPEVR